MSPKLRKIATHPATLAAAGLALYVLFQSIAREDIDNAFDHSKNAICETLNLDCK